MGRVSTRMPTGGVRVALWALISTASILTVNGAAEKPVFPAPFGDLYHSTTYILDQYKDLAARFPQRMRWTNVTDAQTGYVMEYLLAGDFSPGAPDPLTKPVIFMLFGEHAREIITSDTALWFARVLAGDTAEFDSWSEAEAALGATLGSGSSSLHPDEGISAWTGRVLRNTTYLIVPVEVPESRRAIEKGDLCRRKTMKEVDLNRNYPFQWQAVSSRGRDEYGGTEPFSEAESRCVRGLAQQYKPTAYANIHSGEWAMYYPWDHRLDKAEGLPADIDDLFERLNTHCGCTRGPGGGASNYLAFGTSMDYMWKELHVPYSLTFELYGSNNEGKRLADWKLPANRGGTGRRSTLALAAAGGEEEDWEEQGEDWAGGGAAGALALGAEAAGSGLGGRTMGARRSLEAFDCLVQFNPSTLHEYRGVVAGWVNNFLILGDHIGAHNGNATAAAAATPVKVASPPPLAVSPPPLAVSPPPVEAPKAASPPPTQPSPAPLAAVAQVKTAAEASGIVQGGSAQPSPAAAELEQPFHAAAGDSVIIPRKALKPGVEGSHAFRIGGLFGAWGMAGVAACLVIGVVTHRGGWGPLQSLLNSRRALGPAHEL